MFQPPEGNKPPPPLIRAILIFTCTGVSFAHGSNDGQKGMGLIMLILIGCVPLAYSLNKNLDQSAYSIFPSACLHKLRLRFMHSMPIFQMKKRVHVITKYIQTKEMTPEVVPALASLTDHLGERVAQYGDLKDIPETEVFSDP